MLSSYKSQVHKDSTASNCTHQHNQSQSHIHKNNDINVQHLLIYNWPPHLDCGCIETGDDITV